MSTSELSFSDRLSARKKTVRVLILGDYSKNNKVDGPDDVCEKQLENVKHHLIEKGFHVTRLVKDFNDEETIPLKTYDLHFIKKSEHYINDWAEILLFILLKEGDKQSVVREWSHMIKKCPEKCKNSIILNHTEIVIRSLLRGDIKGYSITHDEFNDEKTLLDRAYNLTFVKLYNLLYYKNIQ